MELLSELHRDGATICMVTHDPRFASHADREVLLFDGRIVDAIPEGGLGLPATAHGSSDPTTASA
jgi:ABC-type lipoprotein export system ATPase subunit